MSDVGDTTVSQVAQKSRHGREATAELAPTSSDLFKHQNQCIRLLQ